MNNKNDYQTVALSKLILVVNALLGNTRIPEDRQVYESYLAYAGIMMAKLTQELGLGNDIDSMERLFGHTWLSDQKAFTDIYATWVNFKKEFTDSLQSMTINDRLSKLGLLDEFENAAKRKSESKLRVVLTKCLMDQESIQKIVDERLKTV